MGLLVPPLAPLWCSPMARRSQSSSQGENPLDPNYLPPHYKEYYRIAIDALAENGPEAYEQFLMEEGAPDFLCPNEVEHISRSLQRPPESGQENPYPDSVYGSQEDADGSSGTYWPMDSDTAAPELDLGWPTIYGFQGTEVTTLMHPPPPDNPTIKEEVRRMIRSAQQVIGIVMDIFTDADILSELLDAANRRIPVYIILDQMNCQLFLDMAAKYRVNLNYVEFLRVRTVSGPTYFCRKGSTFKGNLQEKFLLVDCTMVLSGTYSFMWSFEKIHRSIAHIFQGELVSSFDEEFRILFAQSDPLIPSESALAKMDKSYMGMVPFAGPRPMFDRKLHFMFPREENPSQQFPSYGVDPDRHYFQPFRREDMIRQTMDPGGMRMYGKNLGDPMDKMQMSFVQNKQLEAMEAFKRHSFAEGTFENYTSSRQYSRQMFMNNNDEYRLQSSQVQKSQFMQFQSPLGTARPQGLFEKIRGGRQGLQEMDEFDSRYPTKGLPGEGHFALDGPPMRPGYNPSNSSREVRHGSDQMVIGGEGRFGQRSLGRQKFMCQISPTQKQGMEPKYFFHDQDADKKPQENKQGLRSWRISSYLSGIQSDQDEEGLPIPLDPELYDDALVPVERAVPASDTLFKYSMDPVPPYHPGTAPHDLPYDRANENPMKFSMDPVQLHRPNVPSQDVPMHLERAGNESLVKYSLDPIPPFKPNVAGTDVPMPLERKPTANEILSRYSVDPIPPYKTFGSTGDLSVEKAKENPPAEKEKEEGLLSRHDSFRTRTNPLIQRGSRLRSSLIFSSSKLEQHTSTAESVQEMQKEQSTSELVSENETGRTTSKVAEILQKYRGINKDANSTTVTQAKAASRTIHEESEDGQSVSAEEVAYKAVESTVDTKGSMSHVQQESQYRSVASSHLESLLGKHQTTLSMSKVEQMTSSIQTIGNISAAPSESGPTVPELSEVHKQSSISHMQQESHYKSVVTSKLEGLLNRDQQVMSMSKVEQTSSTIQTIGNISPAPPDSKESGPTITEVTEATQSSENLPTRPNSAFHFGSALESMSQNPTPSSSLNKSEEDLAKTDQNFFRKGSMRLKQFLQSKAEKKAEEDLASDNAKAEKQHSTLRRLSKSDSQEVAASTDMEEKSAKSLSVSPPKTSSISQSRLSASTSNVIFSSNLRDDTKVILEQISANSQKNRAEMVKQAQQIQATGDPDPATSKPESKTEGTASTDAAAITRTGSFLSRSRFSRPSPSSPEDRDILLKRMESIRKEKRVYSRFEVFCKKDEQPSHADDNDDKKAGKIIPKLLGNLIKK
ncbi:protein FAM83H isoform X2 [Xenopus tropicalis]|uniref:Protein FAM83H isoform X2 n=1 Tax=Xenopus tropicalis TaxID=8364 RepID=A0A8J1JN89_XENTR|nr:protein FAM83H isoform X2 [Xenopus tropicalis]